MKRLRMGGVGVLALALCAPAGLAGQDKADRDTSHWFALQDSGRDGDADLRTESESTTVTKTTWPSDYREISDFFNVREANANVVAGEWELELESEWVTDSAAGDDDFTFTPNIKYGITNDLYVEVEVLPINLGDGGEQGNGDLGLQVFYQFLHESDSVPALAASVEARIPTGQGSSGVDGTLHLHVTKELFPKFHGHMEGFIVTANGGRGEDDANRRAFQWGSGVGVEYECADKTISTLNYLHRSSEDLGDANQNILEIGLIRELAAHQHLKFAFDVGLDGRDSTPNMGAKILWSYDW